MLPSTVWRDKLHIYVCTRQIFCSLPVSPVIFQFLSYSTLPTVKTLQGMHWQEVKDSKPIRFFWYAFTGMFAYEWFPAYIFPFLNSVSIPCLAAMHATGSKAAVLTNLFGGSINNEGLGLFTLSFDWQYVSHCSRLEVRRVTEPANLL